MSSFKCNFCDTCNGKGCIGQMPGMGGPLESRNFIHNCEDWKKIKSGPYENNQPEIRLAPMTGAQENVGYESERQFYIDMVNECVKANVPVTLGDGTPDTKLLWGIEAVKLAQEKNPQLKASVFVKPYPDEKIFERFQWALQAGNLMGIDIDSYSIITMRNLVHLEKKTPHQLAEIKKYLAKKGIPFAIKGVFSKEDMELVKEVKPDVIAVSNHGGRVEVREGSTAEFLMENFAELKKYCAELWVDGGIRTKDDFRKAASYGVNSVMLGRPFARALCEKKDFSLIVKSLKN